MVFQFGSTNLLIGLGILLAVLMGWQFTLARRPAGAGGGGVAFLELVDRPVTAGTGTHRLDCLNC